jgi:YidC/Oxa1 family membrane protein insertase
MLNWLYGFVGSFGWSIILLTVIVRTVFYPVTAKANVSMRKMQSIGPKVQAIREKYKDNPQMLNMKTMELYREEQVNPFGGCLPILLQIPVFFALYATLEGAVQLRQVPFLWCTDLAAPDTIFSIPLYFFNLPVNPLVLAMTGLMIIQQRMTPMSADPMQKKMMMAMPIIMLLFLYNLPSGLTLYWTVSNFFSIVQLKLQQRSTTPAAAKEA